MFYINDHHIDCIGVDWNDLLQRIEEALSLINMGNFSQPLKPYLRFGDQSNRIIAMPAYIGGSIDSCGIKWIASFPKNIINNIPRASSVVILNDTQTGQQVCIIDSSKISIMRTAAVSGVLIRKYLNAFCESKKILGIVGLGPIGIAHLQMCKILFGEMLNKILLYDIRQDRINKASKLFCGCESAPNIETLLRTSDILITCTVSENRYILGKEINGSLYLDISLRDYDISALNIMAKPFIIDDWDEVNRENTDIEIMSKYGKLSKHETIRLDEIIKTDLKKLFKKTDKIFFAPMGLGVFDIAVAQLIYRNCYAQNIGINL